MKFTEWLKNMNENNINANVIIQKYFHNMPFVDDMLDGNTELLKQVLNSKRLNDGRVRWLYVLTFSDMQTNGQDVRNFLSKYLDKNDFNYILEMASDKGYIDVVKEVLPKVTTSVDDALTYAAENGYVDIVKLLLPRAKNTDNAIELADQNGHDEIVKLLEKWEMGQR